MSEVDESLKRLLEALNPLRGFTIYFMPEAFYKSGTWSLDIPKKDGDGKWEYNGKTLKEAVDEAIKWEIL